MDSAQHKDSKQKTKEITEKLMAGIPQQTADLPPVVPAIGSPNQIQLANVRQECIKLTHSAAKSVEEVLNEAEIYTNWVMTGTKPLKADTSLD